MPKNLDQDTFLFSSGVRLTIPIDARLDLDGKTYRYAGFSGSGSDGTLSFCLKEMDGKYRFVTPEVLFGETPLLPHE